MIGTPGADPYLIGWLDIWAEPIRLDPKWNNGDYYDKEPPLAGLTAALKIITLHANHWEWAAKTQAGAAEAGKDPGKALDNKFKIQATLDTAAAARAKTADANHLLYLVKANQLASADPGKIKAPALVLYSPTDVVFPAPFVEEAAGTDCRRRDGHHHGTERASQRRARDHPGRGQDFGVPCAVIRALQRPGNAGLLHDLAPACDLGS